MGYYCLDAAGIMHGYEVLETALMKCKQGKIVTNDFRVDGGFPVDFEGDPYIMYSADREKNQRNFPDVLGKIYKECAEGIEVKDLTKEEK